VCCWIVVLILILALIGASVRTKGSIEMADPNVSVGKKRRASFIKRKTLGGITVVVPIDDAAVQWSASPADAVAFEPVPDLPQSIFIRGLKAESVTITAEADGLTVSTAFTVNEAPEQATFDAIIEFDSDELD
jgi:hypothetical protein